MPTQIDGLLGVDKLNPSTLVNSTNDPTFASTSSTQPTSAQWVNGRIGTIALAVNQTWQDVTSSRAVATTYANTTGKPIVVLLTCVLTNATNEGFFINGNRVAAQSQTSSTQGWLFNAIIPNGSTYMFNGTSINLWAELR